MNCACGRRWREAFSSNHSTSAAEEHPNPSKPPATHSSRKFRKLSFFSPPLSHFSVAINFINAILKSVKTKFVKKFRKASSDAATSSVAVAQSPAMEASGSTETSTQENESTQLLDSHPTCPPPSYEHVLAESALEENRQNENEDSKEVIVYHKSSKKLYRALAAQWGITCKMSDHCPCSDCQGHYFDCEYDRDNEQEKTDGGLGAGTPMFISTIEHGAACSIL